MRAFTSRRVLTLITLFVVASPVVAGAQGSLRQQPDSPMVLGHGVGLFEVGELLVQDDFDNLDSWVVQLQEKGGFPPARVEASANSLDCLTPGRGCTVWCKQKLPTRVAITYEVVCPTHEPKIKGVQPKDINNFWMANDPSDPDQGLFDSERYTGDFATYSKMRAYYASTGGGKNTTTRMRRYPREVDGRPVEHLALKDKDKQPRYLIAPDRVIKVQLVAYDDVVQYIVDGKLVYQIAAGDRVKVERPDAQGVRVDADAQYDPDRFPVYREGYFGFRMVGTHHVYRNFRVHALNPAEAPRRRPTVRVASLDALRSALAQSNQQIVLEPGEYVVQGRGGIRFSGSNNDVDLSGARIVLPLETVSGRNVFRLSGDNNTLRGGTIESTYPGGKTEVTDFGAYNRGTRFGGMTDMVVYGDDNRIVGLKLIVRGSFPYGYGNMYGIGGGSVVRLSKHCGIRITGDRAVIDGCDIQMEAFGHAIYVQGGNLTTVRNTTVQGTLRPSNDCYQETHERDLAKSFGYRLQWPDEVRGLPIPRDHMINCTEDGIRAYNGAGRMIVDNCMVKKTRGGIKLYMAKSARVTDCTVLDCVVQGYSVPSHGIIKNCRGNAAYGPLLYVHNDANKDQSIELEVLPAPHGLGDHPLAAIKGHGHDITFTQDSNLSDEPLRPIIVGYPMRFDFLSVDYPDVPDGHDEHFARYAPKTYRASGITVRNHTPHPVVLGEQSRENTITSRGDVRDYGIDNMLKELAR